MLHVLYRINHMIPHTMCVIKVSHEGELYENLSIIPFYRGGNQTKSN